MKKLIGIVLVFCMLFALAACGDAPKPAAETPDPAPAPAESQTPAAQTPAPKERISKKEIADMLNKAETAAELQALIDAME